MRQREEEPYLVVVNERGDYSVWSRQRPLPEGWAKTGMAGSRSECIGHINRILAQGAGSSHRE